MTTVLLVLAALGLDRFLPEPRRYHPLALFGHGAEALEGRLNRGPVRRLRGGLALVLLVAPPALLAAGLGSLPGIGPFIALGLLFLALGGGSLAAHAEAVAAPLSRGDLPSAREAVGRLVSRETAAMEEPEIAGATVESVLENGADAVFGALFWFVVLGPGGVVAYRLVNTLDAMWGYRSERFTAFGWAAARADDLLNGIPARLTAGTYALVGAWEPAMACWRGQAAGWKSPNAGPVMAAGAGALGVQLGGAATYDGLSEERPVLGRGERPEAADIRRAV
ncbi:MAG TPA: adenosylcobinamide-phosphate synthase CbiB, partial [Gammaproteobacteria bacterium]|nr:adenosylcobinamide-phosphate synthase CbiB [Gammaproteobacteria bacterium]